MRSFEFNYLVSSFHTRKPYFQLLRSSKALLLLEFWSFSSIWEKDSIKEKKGFGAYPFRNLLFFILLHPLSIVSKPHFFFFFFSYFVFITLGPRSCRKRFPSPLTPNPYLQFLLPPSTLLLKVPEGWNSFITSTKINNNKNYRKFGTLPDLAESTQPLSSQGPSPSFKTLLAGNQWY